MSNPKISVILAIYNVQDYLDECLKSLLNQTMFDDIEVLMVDDGSSDYSKDLVDEYAEKYENFHAFHKENEGPGIARNYGIHRAKGEYIHFLDSDDYITPDAYENLYKIAKQTDCDFVVGRALRFGKYNVWKDLLFNQSFEGINEDVQFKNLKDYPSLVWDTAIWNKLYKKEFFDKHNLEFPNEFIYYEDLIFAFQAYSLAESVYLSNDVFYYWRVRNRTVSITHQEENIKNYKDRLKISNMILDFARDHGMTDEGVFNALYSKWLNHDLKMFLKKIHLYSKEYHSEVVTNTNLILKDIPDELINRQNSYRKVLYQMVKNNDIDSLLEFARLENELMRYPKIPENLDDKYKALFDFDYDGSIEEFIVEKTSIDNGDNNLYINFKEGMFYITDNHPHEITATLIDEDENEYPLKLKKLNVSKFKEDIFNEHQITIPLDFLRDKNHLKVKVKYSCDRFTKEEYLKNDGRHSLRYADFDLDIGIGIDRVLFIDRRVHNSNMVKINNVVFDEMNFNLEGESKKPIENLVMENVVSFEKNTYPVKYDGNKFHLTIPYWDLIESPIKKWELKPEDLSNSISISQEFEFIQKTDKTVFKNSRKKILIENDVFNTFSMTNRMLDTAEKYDLKQKAKKYNMHKIANKLGLKKLLKKLLN
ncbi:glycosyltransferase family 2 protein [Methanobrevibacter sp.]